METQITFPRDAAGLKIPLDTKVLYDGDGNAKEVQAFDYSPVESMWRVLLLGDFILFLTSDMHLNPPDSWEKLLDDLDSGADAFDYETCAYFRKSRYDCSLCIANESRSCEQVLMRDIADRIRKLAVKED